MEMKRHEFFIGGAWVDASGRETLDVINPATELPVGSIALGTQEDLDQAVEAAAAAFESYAQISRGERIALFERIIDEYKARMDEMGRLISLEMGAPIDFAIAAQATRGLIHFTTALEVLKEFQFEERMGHSLVVLEPIGVCGCITPWNWPANQIGCKVAPAMAAGCTVVLKPSEIAPFNAMLLADVLQAAGVPAGVFNLINGTGPDLGAAIASHPGIDMVSFTGSTRAGVDVARRAAPTVKRVAQELGGKSANIILDDCEFEQAVARDMRLLCMNSGQSCNAPSRMLVPEDRLDDAARIAARVASEIHVGDPSSSSTTMGPVASEAQFHKVQRLIRKGIEEGAELECGGTGRPEGLDTGFYVKPTVFSKLSNDMTIAREEIFGPVLALIGYKDDDDAVRIANDSSYGLSAYISSGNPERARSVARRLRTGNVHMNGAPVDNAAPFGGFKRSGNGRERGRYGFEEFLEVKAIVG